MDEDYEDDELIDVGGDEFDGLIVDVPKGLKFPNIYQGQVPYISGDTARLTYGGTIPLDCLPPELHHQVPWKTNERYPDLGTYVVLRSQLKPEVIPMTAARRLIEDDGYSGDPESARRAAENKLVELVQRLGARNLSTDRLFVERSLQIELRGLRMGHEFMGRGWRGVPDHVIRGYEGKFKLIPTKVWIDIREDE